MYCVDTPVGSTLLHLTATDTDADTTLTYSLTSTSIFLEGVFLIVESTYVFVNFILHILFLNFA